MTPYRQGQVVLVPFPFTDLSTSKQRPALILSSNSYNQSHPDLIVAAITSRIPTQLKSDEIFLSDHDLKAAGLPRPSIVRLARIVTIDQRLVRNMLGHLPSETMKGARDYRVKPTKAKCFSR